MMTCPWHCISLSPCWPTCTLASISLSTWSATETSAWRWCSSFAAEVAGTSRLLPMYQKLNPAATSRRLKQHRPASTSQKSARSKLMVNWSNLWIFWKLKFVAYCENVPTIRKNRVLIYKYNVQCFNIKPLNCKILFFFLQIFISLFFIKKLKSKIKHKCSGSSFALSVI